MDTRTDGHTPTHKPRTNARATLMHPAGPPASGKGPQAPQPGKGDGLCPGMWGEGAGWGAALQAAQLRAWGDPAPTPPQGTASWEGSPTGPGAPGWGQIAGSLPHLSRHPLTCHNAWPLLQSTRSWGQHAVPPTQCLASPLEPEGAVWEPPGSGTPGSFCRDRENETLR